MGLSRQNGENRSGVKGKGRIMEWEGLNDLFSNKYIYNYKLLF